MSFRPKRIDKVLVIIIRTTQVFYLCGVALAKLLVSLRTNGYQMKEEVFSIPWYLVLKNPANGSRIAASQSRAVFLMEME